MKRLLKSCLKRFICRVYWSEIKGAEKLAKVLTTKGFAFDEKR